MEKELPPIIDSPEASAVHLSYLRRDVAEIKNKLNELNNSYVTRTDYDEHLKSADDHEVRIRALEAQIWKWVGVSSLISSLGVGGIITAIQHLIK